MSGSYINGDIEMVNLIDDSSNVEDDDIDEFVFNEVVILNF